MPAAALALRRRRRSRSCHSRCAQVALYVEEELHESYGRLIQFVKATEAAAAAAGGAAQPAVDAGEVEGLVRQFADTWKAGIERVHAKCARAPLARCTCALMLRVPPV